jgi:hypothetical protein
MTATKPAKATPANPSAAVEAALAALSIETQARLAEVPSRLQAMLARARRGNPDKRDQRLRDAQAWADNQETLIRQGSADREAELLTGLRAAELGALEALRGGSVHTEVRDVETEILKNGAPVWYRGRKSTKRERIVRPIVSRDGLESLARSHLNAEGEARTYPDGKPHTPAIDAILFAAGMRYRRLYEDSDPERGLKAVDPSSAGGGRAPGNPWDSATVAAIQGHAEAARTIRRIEAEVQADVTAAHGRKPGQKAVWLLREIAGKGSTVYSLVGSGGPAGRAIALFETTLACLAARFGLL